MKTSEPSSPLSPDLLPSRTFIREGPVQLSSVSGRLVCSKFLLTGLVHFVILFACTDIELFFTVV